MQTALSEENHDDEGDFEAPLTHSLRSGQAESSPARGEEEYCSNDTGKEPMMTAADVTEFYASLERLGITIWINGGWGVDALLRAETRPHADLDIFIQQKDVPALRETLGMRGYREIKLEIARPHNFVLGDNEGHEADVHVIVLDDAGNALYGPADKAEKFPAAALSGSGSIAGQRVKCILAEWEVKWHTGYKLREVDFKDVPALCDRFGIDYPAEYAHLKKS